MDKRAAGRPEPPPPGFLSQPPPNGQKVRGRVPPPFRVSRANTETQPPRIAQSPSVDTGNAGSDSEPRPRTVYQRRASRHAAASPKPRPPFREPVRKTFRQSKSGKPVTPPPTGQPPRDSHPNRGQGTTTLRRQCAKLAHRDTFRLPTLPSPAPAETRASRAQGAPSGVH
jgi:hypothetical protein